MRGLVSYHLQEKVATITMDDGKANVVSVPMLAELNAALDQAVKDKAVVLLTGRDGTFSAGFDLRTLYAGGEDALKMLTEGFRLAQRLISFPRPVVIACSGHALAMGVFLVLCGDYRIGADVLSGARKHERRLEIGTKIQAKPYRPSGTMWTQVGSYSLWRYKCYD